MTEEALRMTKFQVFAFELIIAECFPVACFARKSYKACGRSLLFRIDCTAARTALSLAAGIGSF